MNEGFGRILKHIHQPPEDGPPWVHTHTPGLDEPDPRDQLRDQLLAPFERLGNWLIDRWSGRR